MLGLAKEDRESIYTTPYRSSGGNHDLCIIGQETLGEDQPAACCNDCVLAFFAAACALDIFSPVQSQRWRAEGSCSFVRLGLRAGLRNHSNLLGVKINPPDQAKTWQKALS